MILRGGVAVSIVNEAIEYLNSVLKPTNPDYRCIAYRAGGYSIQPHSDIVRTLRSKGVFIDSSVCRNKFCDSSANKYDFRKLPEHINWYLTPDKDFTYEGSYDEGGLFEVPICSERNSLICRVIYGKKNWMLSRGAAKGAFVKSELSNQKPEGFAKKLLNYSKTYQMISFDSMPYTRMLRAVKKIARVYDAKNNDVYISIIGHPKLCDDVVLENMSRFVDQVKSTEPLWEFISFRDLYDEMKIKKI